ncbi:hypothetical protein AWM70_12715 [Paenibacillus yonginensis]|uniref:Copper amine oxidase-like N-terminal domain-containing protein n=2 Tax=Paenibacillus yonginensis TaxID=1462996 RepID=A0A1B1N1Q0_9BACL|nr:hypothetical protein AWM70_12715 [Paenibacillus yonginensis]
MDGEKYPLTSGHPYAVNGSTLIPFRMLTGKLGIQSSWINSTKSLEIQQNGNKMKLTLNSAVAWVNGTAVSLSTKVVQKDGYIMIPLDFVKNVLAADVKVDDTYGTVFIDTTGEELGNVDDFGRKIRTTNLPKNYKDYPYILEDIPNEMYEMKTTWLSYAQDAQTGAEMYKTQEVTSEDMAKIIDRMKKGYDIKLNVDYKTINPSSFAKELYQYENQAISYRVVELENYANWVKKNKIQIEGSIDPEPSMVYYSGISWYVRSKVRFKINSYSEYKDLISDGFFNNKNKLKKGVWYEGYADIGISTNHSKYPGEYMNLDALSSLFENSQLHEVK